MNCIAIDDEPLALNIISEFCKKVDYIDLKGIFINPLEAIEILNTSIIDVVFLDIQMPNITGLEFIKSIPRKPMVIFTTAYTEHALEGFELDAIDYLVKPIPFDRFLRAVIKANELLLIRDAKPVTNSKEVKQNDYFLVKADYKTIKVNFKDIMYVEGVKDYVNLHMTGNNLMTKTTMKNMEEKLPSKDFIRVHRSFIISFNHVKAIENNRILIGEKRIPVGEMYKVALYDLVDSKRI